MPPGIPLIGIEMIPSKAEHAHIRFAERGGRVILGSVLEGLTQLEDSSCMGAVAKSYLEHEPQPRVMLAELWRVLADGAHVIIKVPNHASLLRRMRGAQWSGYRFPDHVLYFTPLSLRRLLESSGFTIQRFGWVDRLPLTNGMWVVARKSKR